jgi:hypothetical protein
MPVPLWPAATMSMCPSAGRGEGEHAVVHLVELALEVADALAPQLPQHGDVLDGPVITVAEVLVSGPQAHLAVLAGRPPGDDVDAEAAGGDGVDRHGHAGDDGRRQGEDRGRRVEPDAVRHGGQARHQGERFETAVPELRLAAEALEFDHRQGEVEAVFLGLAHDRLVQLERRHVLRRALGHEPAVVADGDEDTDVHAAPHDRKPARAGARYSAEISTTRRCPLAVGEEELGWAAGRNP